MGIKLVGYRQTTLILLFTLMLSFVSAPPSRAGISGTLSISATSSTIVKQSAITAPGGEVLSIWTTASTGDPYIYLYDSVGTQVAYNDDSVGLDSRIDYYVATTGNYQVGTKCHSNTPTCSYTLNWSSAVVQAPTNSVVPVISGTAGVGQALASTTGTWANTPTSYAYQWSRSSTSGGTFTNISGATSASYTLTTADFAQYLRVAVTATNLGGSNTATSTSSSQVGKGSRTISITSLGTTSKTYPYSQTLNVTTSTPAGTGAKSFAISAGGTATGCALSDTSSVSTISASSSGTCLVAVTIDSDTYYNAATSSNATFTFSKASQNALSITSTSGNFGTPLALVTSGGSSSGLLSYSYSAGTTTCSLSGNNLTSNGVGTCTITATLAADNNYNAISSSATTITFSTGNSATTISVDAGTPIYRITKNLTATTNAAGRVTFKIGARVIPGCRNLSVSAGNSFTVVCPYKPSTRGYITIDAFFAPSSAFYAASSATTGPIFVGNRTSTR